MSASGTSVVPDSRRHRGPHPEDDRLFAADQLPRLASAFADLCWLLDRGYAVPSSLKLVGDRYGLTSRQRIALERCACTEAEALHRQSRRVALSDLTQGTLAVDGYNVLTTVEAAFGGGVLLLARDGALRDMASMHGSYRKVAETMTALDAIGRTLEAHAVRSCLWYLDRPVSNSGRLKRLIEETSAARGWHWTVELAFNPDVILVQEAAAAASADSAVLDRCAGWVNLARQVVESCVPDAWILDFSRPPSAHASRTPVEDSSRESREINGW